MKRTYVLISILFCIVLVFAGLNIAGIMLEYKKSNEIYSRVISEFVTDYYENDEDSSKSWYRLADIDLDALRAVNPEVIGFLYFENEEAIRYPILYSGDNEKYLTTTYEGGRAKAGSIFMDGRNNPNFSDPHTIIYGHNMKNGTMFGMLSGFKNEEYGNSHRFFLVFLPKEVRRYEIFSAMDVSVTSPVYSTLNSCGDDYKSFLSDELLLTGVTGNAQVITLSTCSSRSSLRFIVNAKLIDIHRM